MSGVSEVAEAIRATARLASAMAADTGLCAATGRTVEVLVASFQAGGKLLLCGNGGSAADAQHWAGELVGRFHYDRPALPAIALTTDSSVLTAIGNDYGYEAGFSRQVEALGRPGDVLFALSTSGRSANVLAAVRGARARGLVTVGFTGPAGGDLLGLCDICLCIPDPVTPRIQEGHEMLGHTICAMVEAAMFPRQR